MLQDLWVLAQHDYTVSSLAKKADRELRRKTHQVIRKVTGDLEGFSFNTAVAAIMELRNALQAALDERKVSAETWSEAVESLLLLLAPMAPHITEELWQRRGLPYSIHQQAWPTWDEEVAREDSIDLVVQVNGKVRDRIRVPAGTDDETLSDLALASARIQQWLNGESPKKVIVVGGKLVNIVK